MLLNYVYFVHVSNCYTKLELNTNHCLFKPKLVYCGFEFWTAKISQLFQSFGHLLKVLRIQKIIWLLFILSMTK